MLEQMGKASVTPCDMEELDCRWGGLSSWWESLITDPLLRRPPPIVRHHPLLVVGWEMKGSVEQLRLAVGSQGMFRSCGGIAQIHVCRLQGRWRSSGEGGESDTTVLLCLWWPLQLFVFITSHLNCKAKGSQII